MCELPCITYLTNVDPSLILIISPVTDCQAKLVLDIGPVQVHLLVGHMHTLISRTSRNCRLFEIK